LYCSSAKAASSTEFSGHMSRALWVADRQLHLLRAECFLVQALCLTACADSCWILAAASSWLAGQPSIIIRHQSEPMSSCTRSLQQGKGNVCVGGYR
jgi:hypothetical protein